MHVCLERAPEYLATQTPKEYIQQLAAAAEGLRRAEKVTGGGGSKDDLLREFRTVFNGAEAHV